MECKEIRATNADLMKKKKFLEEQAKAASGGAQAFGQVRRDNWLSKCNSRFKLSWFCVASVSVLSCTQGNTIATRPMSASPMPAMTDRLGRPSHIGAAMAGATSVPTHFDRRGVPAVSECVVVFAMTKAQAAVVGIMSLRCHYAAQKFIAALGIAIIIPQQ